MFSFLPAILMPSSSRKVPLPEEVMADYIMNKDKKAITALYDAFADDMYHYLVTLSDPTLAKDIVQKTWLKVIENPHRFHTATSVKAWLFTLARNALIDEFRKTNRSIALDATYDGPEHTAFVANIEPDLDASLLKAELQSSFDQALMALTFEQREAFCLQQEGFSLADIANISECKQETIKTRLRYARSKLKTLLEQAND